MGPIITFLPIFHIPFAKVDQDHHDVRSQCTVLFGTRIISIPMYIEKFKVKSEAKSYRNLGIG